MQIVTLVSMFAVALKEELAKFLSMATKRHELFLIHLFDIQLFIVYKRTLITSKALTLLEESAIFLLVSLDFVESCLRRFMSGFDASAAFIFGRLITKHAFLLSLLGRWFELRGDFGLLNLCFCRFLVYISLCLRYWLNWLTQTENGPFRLRLVRDDAT
jgi:hypothetical protein